MKSPQRIELQAGQLYAAMLGRRCEVRLLRGVLEATPPPAWIADTLVSHAEPWFAGEQRKLGRSGWWQWVARVPSVLLVGSGAAGYEAAPALAITPPPRQMSPS